MDEIYFTIAGCNHYFGNEFMEKGMKLRNYLLIAAYIDIVK